MYDRSQIVEIARKYEGVPWLHQGRNIYGLDCVGFIVKVGLDLGCRVIDIKAYSEFYNPKVLIKAFEDNGCRKIHKSKLLSGDIVLINIGKVPMHVGILTMKNGVKHIIHSFGSSGKVREEEVYDLFEKRFRFGFAFPGL